MVVPNNTAHGLSMHLNLSDVSVNNPKRSTMLKISTKLSKTEKGLILLM